MAAAEVARAEPDRLSALAPVFGRAFVDEPMMRWPMGEHGDLVERFTRSFAYFLEGVLGLGLVWEACTAKGGRGLRPIPPPKVATDPLTFLLRESRASALRPITETLAWAVEGSGVERRR